MSKMFDLTGRVALVTGGNGGIGLGMATGLARAGATVMVAGRNAAKNEAAVAGLRAVFSCHHSIEAPERLVIRAYAPLRRGTLTITIGALVAARTYGFGHLPDPNKWTDRFKARLADLCLADTKWR